MLDSFIYEVRPLAYRVKGYNYERERDQPYIIEIWSEKSGDDATIRRVAWRYGVNYIPAKGFNSITNVARLLQLT